MKRLWSVFTDDMEHCYFTGAAPVERHHIFPGNPNGTQAGKNAAEMDLKLKQMAQEYFESHYGSREEFRRIFGRSWL